jgi:hypothetical protein
MAARSSSSIIPSTTNGRLTAVGGVVAAAALGYAGYRLVKSKRSSTTSSTSKGVCPFAVAKPLSADEMDALKNPKGTHRPLLISRSHMLLCYI